MGSTSRAPTPETNLRRYGGSEGDGALERGNSRGVRHARTPRLRAMGPWVGCGVRRALGVVAERVGVSACALHGELGRYPNLVRDVVAHVGVVVDVEVVHV